MKKSIFCCVAFGLASAFAASRPLTIGRSACEEKVEPVVKALDAYLPRVTAGMSDDEAETLAREAMPGWLNIREEVQRRRAEWLKQTK